MNQKIQKRNQGVAEGSIFDVSNRSGQKIEEIMADADVVVMLDISSSMSGERYRRATNALETIQTRYRGRVLLVTFNNDAKLEYGGIPSSPSGGTSLTPALEIAQKFDGTEMKFIIISDGEPWDTREALEKSKEFTDPIDTVFIGNDGDRGEQFMKDIATGHSMGRVDPKLLGTTLAGLIGNGS